MSSVSGSATGCHYDCSGETEAKVVWTGLPIIRPGKDHFARHCKGSKKKGETEEDRHGGLVVKASAS